MSILTERDVQADRQMQLTLDISGLKPCKVTVFFTV